MLNLFVLSCFVFGLKASRILVAIPTPSISHQVPVRPLTLELAKRGHEVVVITTDPVYPKGKGPANFKEIDMHNLSYPMWREKVLNAATSSGNRDDLHYQFNLMYNLITDIFEAQMDTEQIKSLINDKSQKFDLIITEALVRPALLFSHIFKAPVIQFSSFLALYNNLEVMGAEVHRILHPEVTCQKFDKISKWEKVIEMYNQFKFDRVVDEAEKRQNTLIRKVLGPGAPKLNELYNNVQLLFLNGYPIWDSNRAVPPSVVYLGGIHKNPPKELPKIRLMTTAVHLLRPTGSNGFDMLREFILLLCTCKLDAARILAFIPTPSISHQVVFRPLTQELAKRGHEVVVITTDPVYPKDSAPINFREVDVHNISYTLWTEKVLQASFASGNKDDLPYQLYLAFNLLTEIFEVQMSIDEVKAAIYDKKKYDLLIVEGIGRPALALSHIYKVPVIQFSSLVPVYNNLQTLGASAHYLLYPEFVRQKLVDLTVWDKIKEVSTQLKFERIMDDVELKQDATIKRVFGPDVPPLKELYNNIDMLFLNCYPLWDANRPVPPSIVYLGGIHKNPRKDIPKDLKSYLDSSKHGVIYISFGTNVSPSALPAEKIQMLVKVFSRLPYDVLWKWDKDELPGQPPNVKISKWLPQSDLLRHPKLKLFITQGGLQSTDEAIDASVPLIGMPMLGDQWFNVENYVKHGIGVRLDMDTLTEEKFQSSIERVIKDDSFRKNIVRLRDLINDQPQKPLERAVWWVEHILRHGGGRHLRSPAANMHWTEYYEVELLSYLLAGLLLVLSVFVTIIYYSVRFIVHKLKTSAKLKDN